MTSTLNLSLAAVLALAAVSNAYTVHAKGRILCNNQPLPYSSISLMDDDLVVDDHMATSITNSNGYFALSGSARDVAIRRSRRRPDVYIRLNLRHSSSYARFHVDRPLLKKRHRSSVHKDRSGTVDFGTLRFNNQACRAYLAFYKATRDFRTRVGYRVPFDLEIDSEVLLHGGTPYALYDTVKLPPGYALSDRTARHELAHTVRHRYDGSKAHFLSDAVRYGYPRNHYCSKTTNLGFAFNEGWAQFWAGSCLSSSASGTKRVEGNVASALRALKARCGTSNRNMWEVLRRNRGSIHSYYSYASKHKALFGCI